MRTSVRGSVLALAASLSGCAKTLVNFDTDLPAGQLARPADYDERMLYYFGGAAPQERELTTTEVCPKGTAPAQALWYSSASDMAMSLASLGLVTPKTLKVWCQ